MPDEFQGYQPGLTSPARRWFEITKDDDNDLATVPRSLWVGGAGTLVIRGDDGVEASFTVAAGSILPFRAVRVMDTGTTATEIRGLL
jgi:hypothetical protein